MSDPRHRLHPTDDVEAGMEARGRVLHRDKLVSRGLALTMAACTLLFGVAAVLFALGHGAGVPLVSRVLTFALLPLFPFVGLTRTVVRTLVTTEEVDIKWGLWGPRIPLSSITRCEVLTADRIRTEQGLLGPRLAVDDESPGPAGRKRRSARPGYHLFAPGHFTEAVWLEWTDAEGKAQRAVLGSEAPAILAAAIDGARLARGLRITAAESAGGAESEPEAEETEESAARRAPPTSPA